jgi:hypothetical protein
MAQRGVTLGEGGDWSRRVCDEDGKSHLKQGEAARLFIDARAFTEIKQAAPHPAAWL